MMIVEPEGGLVAVLFLKTFYVLIIGKFNVLHNIYSECGYIIYIYSECGYKFFYLLCCRLPLEDTEKVPK